MFEDKQLVWKLRLGDKDALRTIYTKYKDTMYTTAYSILNDSAAAEDALQDVFVNFARTASKRRSRAAASMMVALVLTARRVDPVRAS